MGVGQQDRIAGRRRPARAAPRRRSGPPGSPSSSRPGRPPRRARRSGRGRRRATGGRAARSAAPVPSRSRPRCWNQRQIAPTIRRPSPASSLASAQSTAARRLWSSRSRRRMFGLAGRAEDRARRPLGDLDADVDEAGLHCRALAALVEPLERVLAQDRMEAEAGLDPSSRLGVRAAARSIRTRLLSASDSRPVEHVDAEVAVRIRDRQAASAVQPLANTAEPREQPALFGRQQVVAPRDRAAQRPLPFGLVARPAGQVEARPSRSRIGAGLRSRTAPRRARCASGRPPRRSQIARIVGQRRRRRGRGRVGAPGRGPRTARRRPSRRAAGPDGRAPRAIRSSSRLVTRRRTSGAPRASRGHDVRAGRQQLFQVVEHEERRPIAEVRAERIADGSLGRFAHAERRRDGRLDQRRVAQRGEVDEPDAVREPVADVTRDRQREARLAAATRAGQRDDAALDEVARGRASISSVATDELVTSPGRFEGTSSVRSGRASSATPGTTSR